MKRTLVVTGLIIVMGLMANCAKEEPAEAGDPVKQAWEAMVETYNELETAQDKTELFEEFLREYPDTAYAGRLASSVAYYRGNELGDPEGAYAILAETLAENTDPEARYEIGTAMFPLAMEIGETMDLGAVAEELAATRELTSSSGSESYATMGWSFGRPDVSRSSRGTTRRAPGNFTVLCS